MAEKLIFTYVCEGSTIRHTITKDIEFAGDQISRFIEFMLAQGFQPGSIYACMDAQVEEFDKMYPGKIDELRMSNVYQ